MTMKEGFPVPEKFDDLFKEYFGVPYEEARRLAQTDELVGHYFRRVLNYLHGPRPQGQSMDVYSTKT